MEDTSFVDQLKNDFNPPPADIHPSNIPTSSSAGSTSYDDYVAQSKKNSPYFNQMPTGEYLVKFLGAEMVDTKFGLTPRYRFLIDGVEKQLDSKSRTLHALSGRVGQTMRIIKSMTQDGKNAYIVR